MAKYCSTEINLVYFLIGLFIYSVIFCCLSPLIQAFDIGIRRTACSLSPANYNDPCSSLYDAICDGAHCKCPSGSSEDNALKRCVKGIRKAQVGKDDLSDLPFDFVPGKKPEKPDSPTGDGKRRMNSTSNFPAPIQPQPGYPGQPGGYPQQPVYPQPGYPNQPGYYPGLPGYTTTTRRPSLGGILRGSHYDNRVGEKAGGGVGGGLGLLLLIGLIYFCCCRGDKGKTFRSKLPFFPPRTTDPGVTYSSQPYPNDPSQPPPGGQFGGYPQVVQIPQYPPPGGPLPPYPGGPYPPGGSVAPYPQFGPYPPGAPGPMYPTGPLVAPYPPSVTGPQYPPPQYSEYPTKVSYSSAAPPDVPGAPSAPAGI